MPLLLMRVPPALKYTSVCVHERERKVFCSSSSLGVGVPNTVLGDNVPLTFESARSLFLEVIYIYIHIANLREYTVKSAAIGHFEVYSSLLCL